MPELLNSERGNQYGRQLMRELSPRTSQAPKIGPRAVFLDRDGVIVRGMLRDGKSYAPRRLQDFRLLPGARDAVLQLHQAGFVLIVVTNQPDIGNGDVDPSIVVAMHDRLRQTLPIDAIEMCPHRQVDGCDCRKPKTGMLKAGGRRYGIDFTQSFMVGDRCSDILAGQSMGCYTLFIDRGYDRCTATKPDCIVRSLPEATRRILALTSLRRKTAPKMMGPNKGRKKE